MMVDESGFMRNSLGNLVTDGTYINGIRRSYAAKVILDKLQNEAPGRKDGAAIDENRKEILGAQVEVKTAARESYLAELVDRVMAVESAHIPTLFEVVEEAGGAEKFAAGWGKLQVEGGKEVEVMHAGDVRMMLAAADNEEFEELTNEAQEVEEYAEPDDILESLLTEAMVIQEDGIAAKVARARIRAGGLTPAEREECELKIEAWNTQQFWDSRGVTACFRKELCECGKEATTFESFMEYQTHRKEKGTERWVRVRRPGLFLEHSVVFHEVKTAVCADCAFEKGWDLRAGVVKARDAG